MSIITKTGDDGTTGLMYGRRVPKHHPRVEACGSVDELTSTLGLARAVATGDLLCQQLLEIQNELVVLMGELGTVPEDRARYVKDGFPVMTPAMTAKLEQLAGSLERELGPFKGWAVPGASGGSALLDLARAICRRAERRVCALLETAPSSNREALVYLNRLSDVLWLLARRVEREAALGEGPIVV